MTCTTTRVRFPEGHAQRDARKLSHPAFMLRAITLPYCRRSNPRAAASKGKGRTVTDCRVTRLPRDGYASRKTQRFVKHLPLLLMPRPTRRSGAEQALEAHSAISRA